MVSSCGMSFNSLDECVDDGHALVLEGFFCMAHKSILHA